MATAQTDDFRTPFHPSLLGAPGDRIGRRVPASGGSAEAGVASPIKIAMLDDDEDTRASLAEYLETQGLHVIIAADADDLRDLIEGEHVDAVILDQMTRREDGLLLLRELAERTDPPPILMVSAQAADVDRIVGLELGADDYIAKPFNPREVLARLRAILRRRLPAARSAPGLTLSFAGWTIDPKFYTVRDAGGKDVDLTSGEFKLLHALASCAGKVVARDDLLRMVHGDTGEAYDRAIDVAVSRLRSKLVRHGGGGLIRTVRGEGYLFAARI